MSTRDADLARLLVRVEGGDREAMNLLFEQERPALFRFFIRLCRCESSAEDLVQSTFLSLWQYRRRISETQRPAAYLYSIALNQWRQCIGRDVRERGMERRMVANSVPHETLLVDHVEVAEVRAQVQSAIESLPDRQKETFVLHRFEGLSCPEIAQVCGESVKTVESRLRLALLKLTEKLRLQEDPR